MQRIYTLLSSLVIFLAMYAGVPMTSFAATLSVSTTSASLAGRGDIVEAVIALDSDTSINTFAGSLVYPEDLLEPIAIVDGSSIVSIWISRPVIGEKGRPITYAGLTPGGFSGKKGVLFKVHFRALEAGEARVSIEKSLVLRNDGEGTEESLSLVPLVLSIRPVAQNGFTESKDTDPPEPFEIYRGDSNQAFEGKKYVVFSTTDKMSGIDRYEVLESRLPLFFRSPQWKEAESPYILADQSLTSDLRVRAVDRQGNERIAVLHRERYLRLYEKIVLGGIVLGWLLVYRSRIFKI